MEGCCVLVTSRQVPPPWQQMGALHVSGDNLGNQGGGASRDAKKAEGAS